MTLLVQWNVGKYSDLILMLQDKLQFSIDQEVMFLVDPDTKVEHFIFIIKS